MKADAARVSGLGIRIILNQTVDEKVDNSESWGRNPRRLLHSCTPKSFGAKAKLSYPIGLQYCSTKAHRDFCPIALMGPEFSSDPRQTCQSTDYCFISYFLLDEIEEIREGSC